MVALKGVDELRGVVGTRKVELQMEGVVKHSFNLANMKNWVAEGTLLMMSLSMTSLL